MASPEEVPIMNETQPSQEVLGKRKREDDNDGEDEHASFIPDENTIVPDESIFIPDEDDDETYDSGSEVEEESDEEIEENEMSQPTHDSNMEEYPKCAVYDSAIETISTNAIKIPQKVLDVLAQHGCKSTHVEHQVDSARKLLDIPRSKKLRIALLGDAGKSSCLNSLSDIQDLAKSLSGGQSCTCVPTEYSGAFPKQRKDFAASIRYFDIEKIRELLHEQLEDYYEFTFNRDPDWDEDTLTTFKRKMQNALKTFQVLFCDLDEFRNARVTKETLKNAHDDRSINILDMMLESCELKLKDKILPENGYGYAEYREASTRVKLREAVDPLISAKTNPDQPALWPLVKQVCIGVRGSRVLDGITIIDLPGISDTNELRVNHCKEYVKSCDYIWIVAPISRVIDDGMVYRLLSQYGKIFKGRVAVICTHSDDGVERKLVNYLKDEGQDMTGHEALCVEAKVQKKAFNQISKRVRVMRTHKTQDRKKLLEIQAKEDEMKKIKAAWMAIEANKFGFLVQSRNEFVTEQLREEMSDHLPMGKVLQVYCVSNSHYAAVRGAGSVRGARLSAQATGIPALRMYALTLPAPRLLQAIEDFIKHRMVVFLKNAALWVNRTTIERRAELLELVKKPLSDLPGRLTQRRAEFEIAAKELVSEPMRTKQPQSMETAIKIFLQKNKKHPSTILAFIKKNGNYATKICPKESWNEQFSKSVIDVAEQQWPELETRMDSVSSALENMLIEDIRGIITNLTEQSCAAALPVTRLSELVEGHVVGIQNIFRDDREAYAKDLGNLELDITQHSDTNYFSRTIQPIYDNCKLDSGAGVVRRSMSKLEAHLQKADDQSPFAVVERSATTALNKNDKKHVDKRIQKPIQEIFNSTLTSFDLLIDKSVDDPTEKPVREHLKKELGPMNAMYEKVFEDFERLKAKYPS